jgi:hypothetical protein
MKASQRLVEIFWALYEQNKTLAHGNDEQRRILTRMICEQARFELGVGYGTKSATPNRPPSKDSITFRDVAATKLHNWDWQSGTTRKPQIKVGQESEDVSKQHFIEVLPIDHLGITDPNPIPNPPVPIPNPPTPIPCKPKYNAMIHMKLSFDIGRELEVAGSPYIGNLPASTELTGHLLYHVQFLKMTPAEALLEAKKRATGL